MGRVAGFLILKYGDKSREKDRTYFFGGGRRTGCFEQQLVCLIRQSISPRATPTMSGLHNEILALALAGSW